MENVIPLRRGSEPEPDPSTLSTTEGVYLAVACSNATGKTWREVAARTGWNHGAVSGALSRLHANKRVTRLAEKRDGCSVYVTPEWVEERRVEPRRVRRNLLSDMADLLARLHRDCGHDLDLPQPRCKQCDIGLLLRRYEKGRL